MTKIYIPGSGTVRSLKIKLLNIQIQYAFFMHPTLKAEAATFNSKNLKSGGGLSLSVAELFGIKARRQITLA